MHASPVLTVLQRMMGARYLIALFYICQLAALRVWSGETQKGLRRGSTPIGVGATALRRRRLLLLPFDSPAWADQVRSAYVPGNCMTAT